MYVEGTVAAHRQMYPPRPGHVMLYVVTLGNVSGCGGDTYYWKFTTPISEADFLAVYPYAIKVSKLLS